MIKDTLWPSGLRRGNMEDKLEVPLFTASLFLNSSPLTPWLASAFLIEICKVQSMEKPETGLGRGQGNWLFVIRFLCLNNAWCHQRISDVTLSSCTQSFYFPPCPSLRLRTLITEKVKDFAYLWKTSQSPLSTPPPLPAPFKSWDFPSLTIK